MSAQTPTRPEPAYGAADGARPFDSCPPATHPPPPSPYADRRLLRPLATLLSSNTASMPGFSASAAIDDFATRISEGPSWPSHGSRIEAAFEERKVASGAEHT